MFRILLALMICALPFDVAAVSWSALSSGLKDRCGNYCDVVVTTDNRLMTADSSNGAIATGDVWLSRNNKGMSAFGTPFKAITRAQMRAAGFYDNTGDPMDYARTIGIARVGSTYHALLHVGATYGISTGYYYVPAYAKSTDNGKTWKYYGPVSVEGKVARRIFSSSMAYEIVDGTHYMLQTGRGYGYGGLVAFKSSDGRHWKKIGGNIAALVGDVKGSFADMAYFNGRFHVVYVGPDWQSPTVRHLSSADMINWRIEARTAIRAYKSCNLFVLSNNLYCHSSGKLWRANFKSGENSKPEDEKPDTSKEPPASAEACGNPKITVSGRDAHARWEPGYCRIKLVGPVADFRSVKAGSRDYQNLPAGHYKFRVRPANGDYETTEFSIGGSTDSVEQAVQGDLAPKATVSGKNAKIVWWGSAAQIKLIGPRYDFRTVRSNAHTYYGLPSGIYKARVRPLGGTSDDYEDVRFVIP